MANRHADLAAVAVAATIAAAIVLADVPPDAVRILAGLLLVLLAPGYAVGRALFSEARGGAAEWTVLALALSVAVAIASGLLLNLSPWSISTESLSMILLAVTLAGCAVAVRRGVSALSGLGSRLPPRTRDVALLAAAVLVASAAITLGRTPLNPPEDVRGYTELSQVRTGRTIRLELTSKELSDARYRLELHADGRPLRRWRALMLEPGGVWATALPVSSARGAGVVEASLYKPPSATPYRRVRLDLRQRLDE